VALLHPGIEASHLPLPGNGLAPPGSPVFAPEQTQRPYFTVTGNVNGSETSAPFHVVVTTTFEVPLGVVTTGAGGVCV